MRVGVFLIVLCLIFGSLDGQIILNSRHVIDDPKPNCIETNFSHLKLVASIGPEINDDEFLYKPKAVAVDRNNNLYIFDRAQHRILKFDSDFRFVKYIGRDGEGPGEFMRMPIGMVDIHVGLDEKLYVLDWMAFKVLVFDTGGGFLTEHRFHGVVPVKNLAVDHLGNMHFFQNEGDLLKVFNQRDETLASISITGGLHLADLFFKLGIDRRGTMGDLQIVLLEDSRKLLYFQWSSTMVILNKGKIERQFQLLPRDALIDFKTDLLKIKKDGIIKSRRMTLFQTFFCDQDDLRTFYLNRWSNKGKKLNMLYQFDLRGKLKKVLFLKLEECPGTVKFFVKKNQLFYARNHEKILIFKEEGLVTR